MGVLATDPFTRADGATLGANWTVAKGAGEIHGILTNQAKHTSAGSRDGSYYSAVSAPADQYSQAVVVALTDASMGVTVRSITSGAARFAYHAGQNKNDFGGLNTVARLWKDVNNVTTSLGTGATAFAAGQTCYLEVQSTTLIYKLNGTQQVNTTDSAHASGQFGVWSEHNGASNFAVWDTWEGGDFASASAAVIPPTPRLIQTDRVLTSAGGQVQSFSPRKAMAQGQLAPQSFIFPVQNVPPLGQATPDVMRLRPFRAAPFLARVVPAAAEVTTVTFDPALMAAMSWPWPQIVISQPQVVASGMTPPDNVPN